MIEPIGAATPVTQQTKTARDALFSSLAGQLLLATVGFVLLAQILSYPISVAAVRNGWLSARAGAAELAALAVQTMPDMRADERFTRVFLERQKIVSVVVTSRDRREVIFATSTPVEGEIVRVDLHRNPALFSVPVTLTHMFAPDGRLLKLTFKPELTNFDEMEVVVRESALKEAFWASSGAILVNTFFLLSIVGALVYLTVFRLVVRPMQRIAESVTRFSDAPEEATIDLPEGKNAEMRRMGAALGAMQQAVSASLRQKKRLADLGEAVAKINHDLRNSLSVAQVLSNGLTGSSDPYVREAAPRLERAIERSIALAESTLRYGRAETPLPNLQTVDLRPAINDAIIEGLAGSPDIQWRLDCASDVRTVADPDHIHRIVTNLVRNASKAVGRRVNLEEPGHLEATAKVDGPNLTLEISDNGPGVANALINNLFQPFAKSGPDGGVGLGLAIARELARGMGGELILTRSSSAGATFALTLRNATPTA